MSNLSVKLDEATHQRLKALAAREGLTPHALMVKAIGGELERIEAQLGFVERASQALARAEAGGPVYDGPRFAAYLRESTRAPLSGDKPTLKRPKPTTLAAQKPPEKARAR